jgi:hypothetical protein
MLLSVVTKCRLHGLVKICLGHRSVPFVPCGGHIKNYFGGPSQKRTSGTTPLQGSPTRTVICLVSPSTVIDGPPHRSNPGGDTQYWIPNAYRRARSSFARVSTPRCPIGGSRNVVLRSVIRLSQEMTHGSGSPSSEPTSTSERIPLNVLVMGAHVTALRTSIAASRVNTHTGRRPAGSPRSAQNTSPRLTTSVNSPLPVVRQQPRSPDPGAATGTTPVGRRQLVDFLQLG